MLRSYIHLALRNLRKRPLLTTLNVLGLAVGAACCLLIAGYVWHEARYDHFHEHADRIFRVSHEQRQEPVQRIALTGGTLGPELVADVPEVEAAVRLVRADVAVRRGAAVFFEQPMLQADAAFLAVFSFPLLRGDAATALQEPFTVVLTASAARRYFGDADPLGEVLSLEAWGSAADYTVTGVVADVPSNSHLQFDGVRSFATIEATSPEALRSGAMFWTYVRLAEGANPRAMPEKLDAFVAKHMGPDAPLHVGYFLEPVRDIHLRSDVQFDVHEGTSEGVVTTLAVIALLILTLACVNYMNLATARAGERAREVGVRKVMGAHRGGLMAQFLAESVVVALGAAVLALALAWLATPAFAAFAGIGLTRAGLLEPLVLAAVALGAVLVGLLAGSYPAFVLSGFAPVRVLKGTPARRGGAAFRQGLIVFQFTVSIALLAAMFITFRQLGYLQDKDLGYEAAHLVSVPVYGGAEQVDRLRAGWATLPGVAAVTADAQRTGGVLPRRLVGRPGGDSTVVEVRFSSVAENYTDVLGIEVLAGRGFSAERADEAAQAVLLNERAARMLGWASPAAAVGQALHFGPHRWEVVGVVADYHYGSLREAVEPLLLQARPDALQRVLVRLAPGSARATLDAMAATWRTYEPERPFTYAYAEDLLARRYDDDRRLGQLFAVFAALAVFIAGLGLFGLAAFSAERRTKEIGVRKTLGATTGQIVLLLTREAARLVLLAFVVASPLAYLAMARWLDGFAHHIPLTGGPFLLAGLVALLVALATVGFQTHRAARTNPADALRYE